MRLGGMRTEQIAATLTFDNHWMTITKFFKQGSTGESWVALSSWGERYSVNTNLMKRAFDGTPATNAVPGAALFYYSDFYTMEILPK